MATIASHAIPKPTIKTPLRDTIDIPKFLVEVQAAEATPPSARTPAQEHLLGLRKRLAAEYALLQLLSDAEFEVFRALSPRVAKRWRRIERTAPTTILGE